MSLRRNLNFRHDLRGSVATTFSLSFIPLMMLVGSAVDYSRLIAYQAKVQGAADQAAIGSAHLSGTDAVARAAGIVQAVLGTSELTYSTQASVDTATGIVSVTVAASMPTSIMSSVVASLDISRTAKARAATNSTPGADAVVDDSCIFSLGETLTISTDTMTFNGSPSVNLRGCSLRSNKSMKCNGSSTYATSWAVGDITGCADPHPRQPYVPDIYREVSSNISFLCGANQGGVTWTATTYGALPSSQNAIVVQRPGYTEVHICGNLRLVGTTNTSLTGPFPTSDTVVIVENGGIDIDGDSDVRASRMTFVLASRGYEDENKPIVRWPKGNGSNAGSWAVSASVDPGNPWKGHAVYQNPTLDSGADTYWRSGTTFTFDGILYLPNAQFTVSGQVVAGPASCSKVVVGEFTLNGAVNLVQSAAGCANMQVTQYYQVAVPTVTGTSAWLAQ
jgi:Flp pilus assembly protein TadG